MPGFNEAEFQEPVQGIEPGPLCMAGTRSTTEAIFPDLNFFQSKERQIKTKHCSVRDAEMARQHQPGSWC